MKSAFEQPRHSMVERQLRVRGIRDPRVLAAFDRVPREAFVPKDLRDAAYRDGAQSIGHGQTISQPYMVALATELLECTPQSRILEIGAGSGYQAAILAVLAREVIAVERIPELADEAAARLAELGFDNVEVIVADGTLGVPDRAPFDGIVVSAGAPQLPEALIEQLAIGGSLVCPIGDRTTQTLTLVRKTISGLDISEHGLCAYVPLLGAEGWRS